MKLTLEQLAMWLSCTHEPDLGKITAEQEAAMFAGLSKEWLAKSGCTRSEARQGFLQAVNERISQMECWSDGDRKKVDLLLAERGLPNLETMEVLVKKKHRRIMKRGAIRNEEEYYLVKELLDGPKVEMLPADEARTLWALRSTYENRVRE